MTHPPRPPRFIVVPEGGLRSTQVKRQTWAAAYARELIASDTAPPAAPQARSAHLRHTGFRPSLRRRHAMRLQVVNKAPADGSVLLQGNVTLEQLKQHAPAGVKVFEEHWYYLDRAPTPWRKAASTLKPPFAAGEKTRLWTVKVRLSGAKTARPLKDVLVTAYVDVTKNIGVEAITDRKGEVHLKLAAKITQLEVLTLEPLHTAWPMAFDHFAVNPAGATVSVPVIDLSAPDARGKTYGQPAAGSGKKVKVGVVDTGVGAHRQLKLAGGRNTTTEHPLRTSDPDGHGTHVAGVIAASAANWRRGEAAGVSLYAYRIFEEGDEGASSFAIAAAIKQAALDGCDLVNLSIGGGPADAAVRDAIDQAWDCGTVCIAATGNDGLSVVDYPARYGKAVAVSAIGLEATWPVGTMLDWTRSTHTGKALGGCATFFASFANHSAKVALTAPGVAIVSTIFGHRWGVMSGTSMATPIATGVLARRLAGSPEFKLPRNAARAAAIVALAKKHAKDIGLPIAMQGDGLAR